MITKKDWKTVTRFIKSRETEGLDKKLLTRMEHELMLRDTDLDFSEATERDIAIEYIAVFKADFEARQEINEMFKNAKCPNVGLKF